MTPSQPNTPDAQASVDAARAGGTEANGSSETAKTAIELARLSEALGGRSFADVDEAIKAVKNLNSLVGDRSISDLRKRAETHETYESLISGYADEEGITPDEARKRLGELASKSSKSRQKDAQVDEVLRKVSGLEAQLQERDFIQSHPEAAQALKEIKAIAASSGQSLSEAYESSSLKPLLTKAAAAEEREKMGSSLNPSRRTSMPNEKVREAVDRLKRDRTAEAADAAVKAVLGL